MGNMVTNMARSFLTLGPNMMMPPGMMEDCEGTGCSGRRGKMGAWMPRRVYEGGMAGDYLKR